MTGQVPRQQKQGWAVRFHQVVTGYVSTTFERHFVRSVVVHLYANNTTNRSRLAGSARARAFASTTGKEANAKIAGGQGSVCITGINPGACSAGRRAKK